MIRLTNIDINNIGQMREQAIAGTIKYWQIYETLANLLQNKYAVASTDSTVLWLRGAAEANADRGAFSDLIRTYTETQYQLRYGTTLPAGKMQEASDAVARNLLADLMGDNDKPESPIRWPQGQVPDIGRIAFADARAVGAILFNRDLNDTAAELQQNSAWSGALLFSLLNSNQTGRLLNTGSSGTLDTLNDVRDVLYAAASYKAGLQSAKSTWAFNSLSQKSIDTTIAGTTVVAYVSGDGSSGSLWQAVRKGADSGAVGQTIAAISDVNPNKFLDMLMGAATGQNLLGTTTDANFATRAKTFFDAYGSTLQTIGAKLLPTDAASLANLARQDSAEGASARAALNALSIVRVDASVTTADKFSLHNPATGQGNITQEWIADRAAFTSAAYEQAKGLGGIVQGSQNLRYFDAANEGRFVCVA